MDSAHMEICAAACAFLPDPFGALCCLDLSCKNTMATAHAETTVSVPVVVVVEWGVATGTQGCCQLVTTVVRRPLWTWTSEMRLQLTGD